jgi:transposase
MELSMKECKQVPILEKVQRKELLQKEAALLLKMSVRNLRRRLKKYKNEGLDGLAHKNRKKQGNRAKNATLKDRIMALVKTKYAGWPPTHASQALDEYDNINVNPETLRLWMITEGLWVQQRKRKRRRRWRARKECFGQMLQLDGSEHQWVTGIYWTLLKFIDDATGRIFMRFYPSESYESVSDLTIRYIKTFGKPCTIYTDRGGVYKVNINNDDGELMTNYERNLATINIELIHAYSPQAKGRVERSFSTDQQRLVRELDFHNIKSIEEANTYLETTYIPKHNAHYSIPPQNKVNLHQSTENIDLNNVFVKISTRKVKNDWTIFYKNKRLQIDNSRPAIVGPKNIVVVHEKLDGSMFIKIRQEFIQFKEIKEIKETQQSNVRVDVIHEPIAQKSFPIHYKPTTNNPLKRFRACF